ncbi:phage head closure protein [Acidaminococcus fermentans]|uniref:phage head closure protein n=1 Tax=Acidaminococcus fermentans TaxID=905 RepID=UPI00242B20B1|nr:phage head closure protein [Acidaminococcus fermentans]
MINVEIGTLDKRIRLLKYAETEDEYGLTHQTLVDAIGHRLWARIEPARGKTYYEQYKDKVELVTKITVRYRPGITDAMLVQYGGQTYKITSVVDPYQAHVKLELMCNLKRVGETDGDFH